MRLAALFSGGKDSTLAIDVAEQHGWEVTHLVTVKPRNEESYMFHVPNLHLAPLQAEAMGKPLLEVPTSGEKEKELDPLERALAELTIDGVVVGALASEYQKTRVDRICHRLGIKSFAPLWHKRGEDVLRTLTEGGYDVRFAAVAAEGLTEAWLGRRLDAKAVEALKALNARYGVHVAGEGGEFETLVLASPRWPRCVVVDRAEPRWSRDHGRWHVAEARVAAKASPQPPA
ncbi:MAG TPA: diphthine--ammonia ligase [Candidatus Thermoplasmatota archaeon]|nr:diphthine--ammonia ligase [Candidatus Thermoplasmatota archaeon]